MTLRQRVHEALASLPQASLLSRVVDYALVTLILLNAVALVLESIPAVRAQVGDAFWWFETFSVAVFTVEYLLRIWSCVEEARFASPVRGRIGFAFTPLALVDLLAVMPYYLGYVFDDLRILRVLRLFRIVKLGRYSASLRTLGRVFVRKGGELAMILFALAVLLVIAATLVYFAERGAQPEVFSSIPATMWWAVATLTTVGYGDVYPITALGKVMASVTAVLGIGMFALPAGVIGSGFIEDLGRQEPDSADFCPHCGKPLARREDESGG
jgi:voltage-gated potassium channel